jgi:hypothetical protein
MAIAINFDKAKAERLIARLTQGKSIDGIQSVDDILTLGGVCLFLAMGQGPALEKAVDWSKIPAEQQPDEDEEEDTFVEDLHAAIEYYAQLTLLVANGDYDDYFDPNHKAIVLIEAGEKTVIPIEGIRNEDMPELG